MLRGRADSRAQFEETSKCLTKGAIWIIANSQGSHGKRLRGAAHQAYTFPLPSSIPLRAAALALAELTPKPSRSEALDTESGRSRFAGSILAGERREGRLEFSVTASAESWMPMSANARCRWCCAKIAARSQPPTRSVPLFPYLGAE